MTQEQKAKAYEKALKRAKNYYNITDSVADTKLIELIFPELKESEDEKIRKTLIEMFSNIGKKDWRDIPTKKIIAWLEKQGYEKPIWNEDDESFIRDLLNYFDVGKPLDHYITDVIKWIKSLKDKMK